VVLLCDVFLKVRTKQLANGEYQNTYRLVEPYRSFSGVRHYQVVNFGELNELTTIAQRKSLARRVEQLIVQHKQQTIDLFVVEDSIVEKQAQYFFQKILENERLDIEKGCHKELVDVDSVKLEEVTEIGAEWLCYQAIEQLQLPQLFASLGWNPSKINLALTHLISRAVYPASELKTSYWLQDNSSVCEITGYDANKINKDKLYHISKKLYEVRDNIEQHLSRTTSSLFNLDDKIIIYDLTNTYFESKQEGSLGQYGRSKEKRKDCKLIVLAIVINVEGFIKYSKLFEGNKTDVATLPIILNELNSKEETTKPTIVMDAGIASEDNIQLLQELGYKYICVARGGLAKYSAVPDAEPIIIHDKKSQPITLKQVQVDGWNDRQLLVHSTAKEAKENSMKASFEKRYLEDIDLIRASLQKPRGVKTQDKVWKRLGRLAQKYPSINKYYEIKTQQDEQGKVTQIDLVKKVFPKQEGNYLLRTNMDEQDEKVQWTIYNTIREVESSFRCLKTDLDLRPIYHKTDEASLAHLHLGVLAYSVVNTIRYQLKIQGINEDWRGIVRRMNTQKVGTASMKNMYDQTIKIRKCTKPNQEVEAIYSALKYKPYPFKQKKVVVPPEKLTSMKDNPSLVLKI
jgi:transposase